MIRKAKLSLEKHLLPSNSSPIVEHEVAMIFSVHDEAVDFIRQYHSVKKRTPDWERKKIIEGMYYCFGVIRTVMAKGFDNDGQRIYMQNHIRISAIDRLAKVENELKYSLESAGVDTSAIPPI